MGPYHAALICQSGAPETSKARKIPSPAPKKTSTTTNKLPKDASGLRLPVSGQATGPAWAWQPPPVPSRPRGPGGAAHADGRRRALRTVERGGGGAGSGWAKHPRPFPLPLSGEGVGRGPRARRRSPGAGGGALPSRGAAPGAAAAPPPPPPPCLAFPSRPGYETAGEGPSAARRPRPRRGSGGRRSAGESGAALPALGRGGKRAGARRPAGRLPRGAG